MSFFTQTCLSDRRALVAGASRGIGLAVSTALSEMGARVLGVARHRPDLDTMRGSLSGDGHDILVADLASDEGADALFDRLSQWGFPHIVVANLYNRRPYARLASRKNPYSAKTLAENLTYLVRIMPETIALQRRDGFGRWIAVSSMAATMGGPGQGTYCAQKGAMEATFRVLAVEEGGSAITANIVAPGLVATPGVEENVPRRTMDALRRMNVIGRAATPEEIAYAVAFLASPYASYITGVTLPVCGGADLNWALNR